MKFIMEESIKHLKLHDVTLCTVDCVQPQLALQALIESSKHIEFGSVLFFSNFELDDIPDFVKFIKIPKINNLIEYSNFVLNKLNNYIHTDFCLTVHADGFIHNPHLWRDDFKQWDYIGAPWPKTLHFVDDKTRVGNGGVSLRSKKLLVEVAKHGDINMHEDHFICQYLRDSLAQKNIKIAPLDTAKYFAFELECDDCKVNPETECFAFHGKTYTPFHIQQNNILKQKMLQRINSMSIIKHKYNEKCMTPSDINEHLPVLHKYAKSCQTIAEMGVRYVTSSYAFALARPQKLLCLDIDKNEHVDKFIEQCKQENINAEFVHASSLDYELVENYDLLFIDTLHTYNQLSQELEKHHAKINKYIIFHDTIFWGHKNENPVDSSDTGERGDNVGLVPAIRNFLRQHREWKEVCTYPNNNGLTVIERVDASSYLTYRGVLVGQTKTTPALLDKIIKKNNFSLIIEIGTHRGGLSLWLNDNKPDDCEFYTADITTEHLKIDAQKEKINFLLGDCFTTHFETISNLIKTHKQVLLLCDGGNKQQEFKTFAPLLKPGDVIMCHDFVDDLQTYEKVQQQIGWPSIPESHMDVLVKEIQINNLKPYLFEEAKHCFWGCFKKI